MPAAIGGTSSGSADVTIDPTKVCWQFHLTGIEDPTFAHIHKGGPTVSGPIVVPLGATYSSSGCKSANASTTAAILGDPAGYYVNVHSQKFPDGAMRGQLVPAPGAPQSAVHEVGLATLIPKPVYGGCTLLAKPIAGAVQTAECVPPAGARQGFYPDHLELSTFATDAALGRAYAAASKSADVGSDFGRCNGTSWLGEGPWYHAPEVAGRPGKPGGRRLCYFDGNVAVIVWTHEKFGQATHVTSSASPVREEPTIPTSTTGGGSGHTDWASASRIPAPPRPARCQAAFPDRIGALPDETAVAPRSTTPANKARLEHLKTSTNWQKLASLTGAKGFSDVYAIVGEELGIDMERIVDTAVHTRAKGFSSGLPLAPRRRTRRIEVSSQRICAGG